MKRIILLSLLLSSIFGNYNIEAQNKKAKVATSSKAKIEVYYFHFTRRCITCNAVESVSMDAIAKLYSTQSKNGQIRFTSVNLDDDSSAALAQKCKAEGQALIIISGKKRIDLTDKGFMYAKSQPDRLKAELKKAIDSLL